MKIRLLLTSFFAIIIYLFANYLNTVANTWQEQITHIQQMPTFEGNLPDNLQIYVDNNQIYYHFKNCDIDKLTVWSLHLYADNFSDYITDDFSFESNNVTKIDMSRDVRKLMALFGNAVNSDCFYTRAIPANLLQIVTQSNQNDNVTATFNFLRDVTILHGGGKINNLPQTNSLEAVTPFLNKVNLIEFDLIKTDDGKIVGLHDKPRYYKYSGKYELIFDEFMTTPINGKYTPLSSTDILQIFLDNPHLTLVTDKERDVDLLMQEFAPLKERMIIEVFVPESYWKVKNEGFVSAYALWEKIDETLLTNMDVFTTSYANFIKNQDFYYQALKNGKRIMIYSLDTATQIKIIKQYPQFKKQLLFYIGVPFERYITK